MKPMLYEDFITGRYTVESILPNGEELCKSFKKFDKACDFIEKIEERIKAGGK